MSMLCAGFLFHTGFFLERGRFILYYVPLHSMPNSFILMKAMQLLYTKCPMQLAVISSKPGEGKPGEGKPGEGKPGEGKPGEGKLFLGGGG